MWFIYILTVLTVNVASLLKSKGPSMIADIPPLKFEVSGITRLLRNINAKKAHGPDNLSLAGFWIASHAGIFREFCRS